MPWRELTAGTLAFYFALSFATAVGGSVTAKPRTIAGRWRTQPDDRALRRAGFPESTSGPVPGNAAMGFGGAFGKLPLSFEANQGQADFPVRFLARGRGYSLFLTPTEAVLVLRSASPKSKVEGRKAEAGSRQLSVVSSQWQRTTDHGPRTRGALLSPSIDNLQSTSNNSLAPSPQSLAPAVLRMKLVGANPTAQVAGIEELPGKSNYFIGNDPKKWRIHVPNYAKVQYQEVYPGVNLVYYGNPAQEGQLEYDFVVAPGADPKAIRLGFETGNGKFQSRNSKLAPPLRIDAQGDLVAAIEGGELRFHKPLVYQMQSTVDSRQLIVANRPLQPTTDNGPRTPESPQSPIQNRKYLDGRYVLRFANRKSQIKNPKYEVGFEVAAFDRTKPLIIDPVLVYSTYLGGTGNDYAQAIAVDASGSAYVTGYTYGTDFPTLDAVQPSNNGAPDLFVAKLNGTGTGLIYSTYLGGRGENYGLAVAVNSSGNAFVTGFTNAPDFPTASPLQAANAGGYDAFLTELDPAGSALVYSTYLGGSGDDYGYGLAVDAQGNAYATGFTTSWNFPTTAGAFQTVFRDGAYDAFVMKLEASGAALVYSTYLGGSGEEQGRGIAVDTAGSAYVTGQTNSPDFPAVNAFQANLGVGACSPPGGTIACFDAFVAKLDASGSSLRYSTYLGGSGGDYGYAIAVDAAGAAYVTGYTQSSDFPTTPHAAQVVSGGSYDAFVAKVNPQGSTLTYATYLGGMGAEIGYGIAVDSAGSAWVTGSIYGNRFPLADPLQHSNAGFFDVFVAKLDGEGASLIFSTYLGGTGNEEGHGIALDYRGDAYVTGGTFSTDFPTSAGAFQPAYGGGAFEAFVAKIASSPRPTLSLSPTALSFADQMVDTSSPEQAVTLSNIGSDTLEIESLETAGDFAQSNTCGSSVAPQAHCLISVTFHPTGTGRRTGTLTVKHNAPGSPHTISLAGQGILLPLLDLSSKSLDFPAQIVGTASAAQNITLINAGNARLEIASILAGGDYSQSNTCGQGLKPGASCAISVTFTPPALGTSIGTLVVNDNAPGSPHLVTLTGHGVLPAVTLSTVALAFADQRVGTTSPPQTVTLTNSGTATLNLASIVPSGDFAATDTCGTSLAAGATCAVRVTFRPTATGSRTGALTLRDDAPGSPQVVSLSGAGLAPAVTLSQTSLSFPNQGVGTTSPAQVVTLSNSGTAALSISSIAASGDFTVSTTCGGSLSPGGNCALRVVMTPAAIDTCAGAISIHDDASGSPHTIALSGRGVVAYGLVARSSSGNVIRGIDSVTFDIAASSPFGFTAGIRLDCAGNTPAQCAFSPAIIAPGQSSTLTVSNLSAIPGDALNFSVYGTNGPQAASVALAVLLEDFSLSAWPSSATMAAGERATYALGLTPSNGFSGSVSLACSGAPQAATCSISPAAVTLSGATAAAATVTVTTTARAQAFPRAGLEVVPPPTSSLFGMRWFACLLALATLASCATRRGCHQRTHTGRWNFPSPLGAIIFFALFSSACGGGGGSVAPPPPAPPSGTPAGTYTLKIAATTSSGALTHQTTLTLKVN
jgi:hypothetical protein